MKIHTFLKPHWLRTFLKRTEGVAAIEFALTMPVYILLISAIFIIGAWLFANATLTAAVNEASLRIMMGHPDTVQSDSYYTKYLQNTLQKYINSSIPMQNSSGYVDKVVTYSINKLSFDWVENSPVLVAITAKYSLPCPVPLVSNKTFRFSFTSYAAVVGLTET